MILVIADWETDERGNRKLVASHGIDLETDAVVILPPEDPRTLGAKLDPEFGEYVIHTPSRD